jgi:hypothetical protein
VADRKADLLLRLQHSQTANVDAQAILSTALQMGDLLTAYVLLGPPMRYALPAFLVAQAIKNLYLKGASYYVAQNHVGEDGGLVQNLNTPRIPGAAFLLLQSQQGRSLADCVIPT